MAVSVIWQNNFLYQPVCIFAVLGSNIKDVQQAQLQPLWTYGMGYVLSVITLSFGLMMTGIININIKKLAV
ncbi:hypothetical protein NZD88_12580 [Chryseobacterium antibioticum]|uniref:Uncharacterized protein n=1 Tax=Chryseobacterium pyrolae TaxID=2987481 RepID=A0ABT2IIA2_9FLAO|nr:hypothetical protein [Chryseobacterium pyrolae]MCT2408379.1 hypothetical protein [Chryseobacterium pyrolae]